MTKIEELKAKLAAFQKAAQDHLDKGELDKAQDAMNEIKKIQAHIAIQEELDKQAQTEMQQQVHEKGFEPTDSKKEAIKDFAAAARAGFPTRNQMSEGSNPDGGYTVPEDIETMVREKKSAKASLKDFVTVESVTAPTGRRTYKKRTQRTGFAKVAEGGNIPAGITPQFEVISYSVSKYAGYFPITNELLADSDENIVGILTSDIAEESRVTDNREIFAAIYKKKTATSIKNLNDIKNILNKTLGQAYKPTSKIFTNDNGLAWLDTLVDKNDRYMLEPDPTNSANLQLRAGATVVPIVVIPNTDWGNKMTYALTSDTSVSSSKTYYVKNGDTYTAVESPAGNAVATYYEVESEAIPFVIGDLASAVTYYDKAGLSIINSNVAVAGNFNAFEQDMTLFRAIEREDIQVVDEDAIVYAELAVTQ